MDTPELSPLTVPPTEPAVPEPKKSASYGALISIVIILMIVVVGAFYAWGHRISVEQGSAVDGTEEAQ